MRWCLLQGEKQLTSSERAKSRAQKSLQKRREAEKSLEAAQAAQQEEPSLTIVQVEQSLSNPGVANVEVRTIDPLPLSFQAPNTCSSFYFLMQLQGSVSAVYWSFSPGTLQPGPGKRRTTLVGCRVCDSPGILLDVH